MSGIEIHNLGEFSGERGLADNGDLGLLRLGLKIDNDDLFFISNFINYIVKCLKLKIQKKFCYRTNNI
jgi:hypothetical protein